MKGWLELHADFWLCIEGWCPTLMLFKGQVYIDVELYLMDYVNLDNANYLSISNIKVYLIEYINLDNTN